jgi:DNA-binding IclR family transcriptional regulator
MLTLKLGAVFEFHCSAHGKIALAYGDPSLLENITSGALPARGPRTITDPAALRREIKKVRKRGWADAPEQAEPNMNALTAPIVSGRGVYEGSIGIFGSIDQIPADPPPALVRAVIGAAQRISDRLGAA